MNSLPFASTCVDSWFFGCVHVGHLSSFLCCVVFLCFACIRPMSCVPNVASVWIVRSWLPLRFSLTFINRWPELQFCPFLVHYYQWINDLSLDFSHALHNSFRYWSRNCLSFRRTHVHLRSCCSIFSFMWSVLWTIVCLVSEQSVVSFDYYFGIFKLLSSRN
jgi:hypothetical protein